MTTAVIASTPAGEAQISTKFSRVAKRLTDAFIESRTKSAMRALRQHGVLIDDLSRRQDHSPLFLGQDKDLPFKI